MLSGHGRMPSDQLLEVVWGKFERANAGSFKVSSNAFLAKDIDTVSCTPKEQ